MKCKVFKIQPQNEFDELKLNKFLANVELKQVFASIVNEDGNFWSVLAFYEDEKAAGKNDKSPDFIRLVTGKPDVLQIDETYVPEKTAPEPVVLTAEQENLYNALKKWRNELAARDGLAPYMIAHNDSLMQIASTDVQTAADLLQIKGFGEKRAQKYGEEILKILSEASGKES